MGGRRTHTDAVLAVAVVVLAACGQDGGTTDTAAPEPTTTLSIAATDNLRFDPDTISVPAGEEISVKLTSGPAVLHDLVIAEAVTEATATPTGEPVTPVDSDDVFVLRADAGGTATASFRVDAPGSYELYCSVPGHRRGGMVATLTVVG
jgi:nitrite reductase (NO-forming)